MTSLSMSNKFIIDSLRAFKPSDFNDEQYDMTVKFVRQVLDPWLELHFGKRCPDFESGCEICRRWHLADQLLQRFTESRVVLTLEKEIALLEENITWRKELLEQLQREEAKTENGFDS